LRLTPNFLYSMATVPSPWGQAQGIPASKERCRLPAQGDEGGLSQDLHQTFRFQGIDETGPGVPPEVNLKWH